MDSMDQRQVLEAAKIVIKILSVEDLDVLKAVIVYLLGITASQSMLQQAWEEINNNVEIILGESTHA